MTKARVVISDENDEPIAAYELEYVTCAVGRSLCIGTQRLEITIKGNLLEEAYQGDDGD